MEQYALDRAERRKAIIAREEKERKEKERKENLVTMALEPVRE